jgi:prepilin-type N-terminal cleavage/methylation domain-containing protein
MSWWWIVRHNSRYGFTLTELMVATAVSAYMISMAFAALSFTSRAIRRGEDLGARNQCLQSSLLWSLSGRDAINLAHANGGRCHAILLANQAYGHVSFVFSDAVPITTYAPGSLPSVPPSVSIASGREWTTRIPLRAFNPTSVLTTPVITDQTRIETRPSNTSLTLTNTLSPPPASGWQIGRSETFFAPAMRNEKL